jgi:hypothetical protein
LWPWRNQHHRRACRPTTAARCQKDGRAIGRRQLPAPQPACSLPGGNDGCGDDRSAGGRDPATGVRRQDLARWRHRLRAAQDGAGYSRRGGRAGAVGPGFERQYRPPRRLLRRRRGLLLRVRQRPPFALALVVLAVGSLWLTVVLAYSGSEVQQSVPDSLRGRVSAITSMGQNGLAGLGAIAVATAAGRTGAGVAVAGLAVLVGVLGITLSAVASRKPAGPPVPGSPSPGNSGAP